MRADSDGDFWHIVAGAAVGVLTQYASDVVVNLAGGMSIKEALLNPQSSWADYAGAALSGALAATGISAAGSVIANASIEGIKYLANCDINGENVTAVGFMTSVTIGGVSGAIGGDGVNGKRLRGVYKRSKQVMKTAKSASRVAKYAAKKRACITTALKGVGKTVAAGAFSNVRTYTKMYTRRFYKAREM